VSLSHIAKVLITKFDRGFSSTTMEEQSEWDYNVPVSIKQKKVLDIYCAFRAFEWRGWYTSRKHRERTAVKEIEGRTRHFPNTVRGITGRLCRGARLHTSLCTMNSSILIPFISIQFKNLRVPTCWNFQWRLKYNFLEKGVFYLTKSYVQMPMPMHSTAWFCGSSFGGIVGSNPFYVSILCVLCVIRELSLRRNEHSSRRVLPRFVCVWFRNLITEEPWNRKGCRAIKNLICNKMSVDSPNFLPDV